MAGWMGLVGPWLLAGCTLDAIGTATPGGSAVTWTASGSGGADATTTGAGGAGPHTLCCQTP